MRHLIAAIRREWRLRGTQTWSPVTMAVAATLMVWRRDRSLRYLPRGASHRGTPGRWWVQAR